MKMEEREYVQQIKMVTYIDHMPSGKVIVEEIETNEGYVLDEKKYEINLGYNEVYMFSVSNHRQKGTISIEKS